MQPKSSEHGQVVFLAEKGKKKQKKSKRKRKTIKIGLRRDSLRDKWRKKWRWKKVRVLINDPVMAERDEGERETLHKERRRGDGSGNVTEWQVRWTDKQPGHDGWLKATESETADGWWKKETDNEIKAIDGTDGRHKELKVDQKKKKSTSHGGFQSDKSNWSNDRKKKGADDGQGPQVWRRWCWKCVITGTSSCCPSKTSDWI